MEYLVAVADERQFTRAAELTGVSQSGLSAAIRNLEVELGTRLFSRTTRRVEPTEAGLALLPFARSMLSSATEARDAVVKVSRELAGTLRVGSEQCLGVVDVATLLERFHRRYPRVEIAFQQAGSHELLAGVRDGELDAAFVATADHVGVLPRTVLGQEPVVFLCPQDHPLASRATVDRADLGGESFIDFHPSWAVRQMNDDAFAARGVRRRVRFTVNDVHTLLDLVDRGLGVALVPRHVAAKPQAARLVALPVAADGAADWIVSMVTNPTDRIDSPAPHLTELLTDTTLS
ncbi:LysR family transcriptional regulator [Promicromonospora sp. NPDC060204]|uniref:LysR family transcriptional regulator n=1 Tax=unclassified Promicromonospora TaxID=2647929 RepID=UPI00364F396E